jgi:hypothetical protein
MTMAQGQKTGGRKAGTPNKATANIKARISRLIDERFDSINNDLNELEPKERVTVYLKFLEYVLPKQREQKIDLSLLTDNQIDDLLNRALFKLDSRP